jgi:hypothetical protein
MANLADLLRLGVGTQLLCRSCLASDVLPLHRAKVMQLEDSKKELNKLPGSGLRHHIARTKPFKRA